MEDIGNSSVRILTIEDKSADQERRGFNLCLTFGAKSRRVRLQLPFGQSFDIQRFKVQPRNEGFDLQQTFRWNFGNRSIET